MGYDPNDRSWRVPLETPLINHHGEILDRIRACLRRRGPSVLRSGPLPEAGELAQRLCSLVGPPFEVALLATGDGDAFDNALKLARAATHKPLILACPGPRRARSLGAISLSGTPGRLGVLDDCELIPASPVALEQALRIRKPAALLVEPVHEDLHPLGPSLLKHMEVLCKQAGVLLLVDETWTGLGRCGHRFAFQAAGVEPAAVIVGQSLGGGAMAISATLVSGELHRRAFGQDRTFDLHTATMAGNAVACEAALGFLDILERKQLAKRAASLGERLASKLTQVLGENTKVVGTGLLLGIQRDGEGILVAPPLDITEAQLKVRIPEWTRGLLKAQFRA